VRTKLSRQFGQVGFVALLRPTHILISPVTGSFVYPFRWHPKERNPNMETAALSRVRTGGELKAPVVTQYVSFRQPRRHSNRSCLRHSSSMAAMAAVLCSLETRAGAKEIGRLGSVSDETKTSPDLRIALAKSGLTSPTVTPSTTKGWQERLDDPLSKKLLQPSTTEYNPLSVIRSSRSQSKKECRGWETDVKAPENPAFPECHKIDLEQGRMQFPLSPGEKCITNR